MKLTDFLLARIAEDETNDTTLIGVVRKDWTARWMAECEAKRRIVAAHPLVSAHDLWGDPMDGLACEVCDEEADLTNGGYELEATGGCVTLRALALPYADHPDYRDEWKP